MKASRNGPLFRKDGPFIFRGGESKLKSSYSRAMLTTRPTPAIAASLAAADTLDSVR